MWKVASVLSSCEITSTDSCEKLHELRWIEMNWDETQVQWSTVYGKDGQRSMLLGILFVNDLS